MPDMPIKANVTFLHTDDPYLEGVVFQVLPREGERIAIMPSPPGSKGPHQRIDRVEVVRHHIVDGEHHVELLVGRL